MANRIQNDYRSHIQGTSPDMDKLWNRIEQRIDNSQTAAPKAETPVESQPQITVSKSSRWIKYAAAAACLVAVVIGTTALLRSKSNDISTDSKSASVSSAAPAADREDTKEKTNDDATSGQPEKKSDASYGTDVAGITNDKKALMPESANLGPNEQVKALMRTADYEAADADKRCTMVEELAEEMKARGEITGYELVRRDSGNRIELTLTDGTVKGIILK